MGDVILEDRFTELLANSHPAKQAASDNKVVSIGANNNADTGDLQSNAGVILYLHEPSAFRPMAQIRSEQTVEGEQTESIYYFHLDHIGTPLELTDEQGRIVWQANYTGFGQARIINSGITNLIRYPGQYEDSEIGLHCNRFRYYDPSSGQYTQQDPIGLMGGEQLSQYVADPVNWVDVLGLQKDCPKDNHYTPSPALKNDPYHPSAVDARRANGDAFRRLPSEVQDNYWAIRQGKGTPRTYTASDQARGDIPSGMKVGDQKVTEARGGLANNRKWSGALEWDVPGTNHRILQKGDCFASVLDHKYGKATPIILPWDP
jgi:RHS repeat-associated protein